MKRWKELLAFILVVTHLLSLPGLAATGGGSASVTPAAKKVSSEKIAGDLIRLPGHVLPAITGATPLPVKPGSADEPIRLTVVLKRTDQAGFDKYLHDIYDSNSPIFQHFLKPTEVSDRFGPSKEAYKHILDYLIANGFKLVDGSANRLTLTVRGTRAQAESAFSVRILDFEAGGRRLFANDADPAVPRLLASDIQAVIGLASLPEAAPSESLTEKAVAAAFLGGFIYALVLAVQSLSKVLNDFFTAHPIIPQPATPPTPNPYNGQSPSGIGQKIGITSFSNFLPSDVADWLALSGLSANLINNVSQVHVNGGAPLGSEQGEVLLAINTILTTAPGAQIVVFDAPYTGPGTSFQTLFNAMISDGVTIISNTFGYCEDQTTLADVQSIDIILAAAAASGISVLSATGDSGSACSDGTANTIAVPADSPHVTAVGGTTLKLGPGLTYGSETWWDGSTLVPPTGQGGFGVSRFFPLPTYQSALVGGTMRSVPDVVAFANADLGPNVCEADAGGCPTGLLYGGTSLATPLWAAFVARINERVGHNLGLLNLAFYPLSGTPAFHSAARMGTDTAHVGLGSLNENQLELALTGTVPGPADPSLSNVIAYSTPDPRVPFLGKVQADGTSSASIVVQLNDGTDNIAGRTVSLSGGAGSHAVLTPASGVTTADNGAFVFTVTDSTVENLTFTATDETDNVTLTKTVPVNFVGPPPSSAGIAAFPTTVTADGVSTTTITVTLQDAQSHGIPGKQISLSQGSSHSVITGPNPSVTDGNGQIMFAAADLVNETVTYTGMDVSDNVAVPGSAVVIFSGGSGSACGQNLTPPVGLNGYKVTPFATGFATASLSFSNVNFGGCSGASTPAFLNNNVYIPDFLNGKLYELGLGGGGATNADLLSTLGPTLGWPVVGKDGSLYATRAVTGAGSNTGEVVQLDPNTGAILRTLASGLLCANSLVVDPLSGDLFLDGECFNGANDPNIYRIANPSSSTPTLSVYATLSSPNGQMVFSPNGTLYAVSNYLLASPSIVQVPGTNTPQPVTPTTISGIGSNYWIAIGQVSSTGAAQTLITLQNGMLELVDITNTPTVTNQIANNIGGGNIGPDGCLYMPNQDILYKLTDPTGGCSFLPTNAIPSISLTPTLVSPNPALGSAQTFTAQILNLSVPAGTPIRLMLAGPNQQALLGRTNANGQATFTYTGAFTGTDTLVATSTVGAQNLNSNIAQVTWTTGPHTTFVTLNSSPKSGTIGTQVTVIASLTDVSSQPPVALAGQSVTFTLEGIPCAGVTDVNGNASCAVTPTTAGVETLTASFTGITGQYLASSDTKGFTVNEKVANLSYTGPTTFKNGSAAALSALLTNAASSPISGKIINFTLGSGAGAQTCNGTTDTTGTASCNIASVNQPVGPDTLTSSFAGDLIYQGTSVPTSVTINTAQVAVPNVVGDTQSAASTAITGATLVVGTVTMASSSTVPAGDVISQSPVFGTLVAPGSAVNLVVSTGPAQVAVPNVVGDTQMAATTAITGATLVVGTVTMASSSTVPAGSVISQSPVFGTLVAPGSAVNLVVSTGPAQVAVPNVVGDTQSAASTAITGATLVVGTVTMASSSTVPAGDVISQSPTAGTLVAPGSAVNLVVSTGPAQVAVPNVVGDTQSAATTAIKGAGLVVGTVTTSSSSTVPAGSVISQSPTSGTLVAPGSAVNLVVSSGPASAGRPEISGHITAKGKGPSGTLFVDLKLTDTGKGDAVNVQIGQLALRTLCGSGKVTYNAALSGPLPLKVGNIKKGASATVRLFFNVPSKVTGFSITENGTMQDTVGKNYNYSTSQTVTLCREWDGPGRFGDCDHDDCGNKCDHDDCDHCDRF